jgi:hypothetical protein
VVVDWHEEPPVITQHPADGQSIECRYRQALAVHRDTPLRLVKVLARDHAHFEMAIPLGSVITPLFPPLYEVMGV